MLRSIKQLYGNKLEASDGEIGHVKDFYFDDHTWAVRYVIVDTGSWLAGRQVLISPHAFGRLRQLEKVLRLKLTRRQIEDSPPIETHKTVSRQYEEAYHSYYAWPCYWQGDALWGMNEVPTIAVPTIPTLPEGPSKSGAASIGPAAHLRSTQAVAGYAVEASDGATGHVFDFMMDGQNWRIRELVIKIGHRFSGREVRIPAGKVSRISYEDSKVLVDMTKEEVEQDPSSQVMHSPAAV